MTVDAIGTNPSPAVFDAGLPPLAYEHAENPEEAHRLIRQARLQGPIAQGPHGPEVLSYELARTVLRDPRFCMPKGITLAAQGITSGRLWDKVTTGLLSRDGADHNRLRRLVSQAFTPRSTARLTSTIAGVITELVDPVTSVGRCDVVADIARQYPIPIICGLLGAPRQDWQLFSDWADDIFKALSWDVANDVPVIMAAFDELDAYIDDMVAQRRHNLTDDLISELIRAEHDGDRLSVDELRMLAEGLLMAGTDTTRNQLAAAVQDLCDYPEQWALLAEQPALAPQAVEELIRHNPVVFATMRKAVEDVELGGVRIPAGTLVIINTAAANRDPCVYDEPDRLDITREAPATTITFGGGIHYCLGAHLARAELAQALTVITRRMPNPHRSGPAPWKPLVGITGPTTLPIEFDAGH
ncbi:MAG: cytochrome P450 [Mycobacterium sp.]|uniref:cytochrome P450 n=1 Tax=Mycobacterium sp. TaxID=1785 RepID=UPI003C3CEE80